MPMKQEDVVAMARERLSKMQEGKKKGDPKSCQELLGLLIAMERIYKTAHWQAKGKSFEGDHSLFQDLYWSVDHGYDALAEKMVGAYGNESVDDKPIADIVHRYVTDLAKQTDPVKRGLKAEMLVLDLVEDLLEEGEDKLSAGMENFLQGLADTHEQNLYKLGQRADGEKPESSGPKPKAY